VASAVGILPLVKVHNNRSPINSKNSLRALEKEELFAIISEYKSRFDSFVEYVGELCSKHYDEKMLTQKAASGEASVVKACLYQKDPVILRLDLMKRLAARR